MRISSVIYTLLPVISPQAVVDRIKRVFVDLIFYPKKCSFQARNILEVKIKAHCAERALVTFSLFSAAAGD